MNKTALIVDDSRSARFVLKRMLEAYELNVDTSESAEEALEYLTRRRPDVIFMDHLMPGMDGFEAVTAIKRNPETAMIPIMMYTSQEGEVYVGQARALGAVGVLPKTVEPVEVSKVLASLHLVDEASPVGAADAAGATIAGPASQQEDVQLDKQLRDLLQDLFDQQRVILQSELRESHENLTARFASELKQSRSTPEEAEHDEPKRPAKSQRSASRWLVAAVILLGVIAVWQRLQVVDLEARNRELLGYRAFAPFPRDASDPETAAYLEALDASRMATLEALEWGANRTARYAFDEIPLGQRRLQLFEELLTRLQAIGFTGVVAVDVHVGNFCMVEDASGSYRLAPPEMEAALCDRIGYDSTEAIGVGARQSVAFANFLLMTEERSGGAIRFDISSRGNTEPRVAYPPSTAAISAADWNMIAALNNRVDVALRPDGA